MNWSCCSEVDNVVWHPHLINLLYFVFDNDSLFGDPFENLMDISLCQNSFINDSYTCLFLFQGWIWSSKKRQQVSVIFNIWYSAILRSTSVMSGLYDWPSYPIFVVCMYGNHLVLWTQQLWLFLLVQFGFSFNACSFWTCFLLNFIPSLICCVCI